MPSQIFKCNKAIRQNGLQSASFPKSGIPFSNINSESMRRNSELRNDEKQQLGKLWDNKIAITSIQIVNIKNKDEKMS